MAAAGESGKYFHSITYGLWDMEQKGSYIYRIHFMSV